MPRERYHQWTPEREQYLIDRRAEGWTAREIAEAMGMTQAQVANKSTLMGARAPLGPRRPSLATMPPSPPAVIRVELDRDPVAEAQARREHVKALREEREELEAVAGERSIRATLETIASAVAKQFDPPPPYRPPARKNRKPSVETMVQHFSDWHGGEVVKAESVRDFNHFDKNVLRTRATTVAEAHLTIKEMMEAGGGWRFEKLVLALNGDFVSGTIHELEKHGDHENVVWAVYETSMVLAESIRQLAAAYPEVEIFCTSGNHGRLPDARRVQQKEPTRSWDTVVYLFAREHLRLMRHVKWWIPNSYTAAFEVYGWRFLQTHGHDVKSWNSIPFYGLNRLVTNINALESGRGTPIHYWLFGHFHTSSSLPHATGEMHVNGSLIGGTEFSVNALGKADRPQQFMCGVHPEKGLTGKWSLYAEPSLGQPAVRGAA
jgi:hypothetical protein